MMHDPDKIIGSKVFHLIEQVRRNRTILKMNVLGTGYECLTIITGTDQTKAIPSFFIDYPGGLAEIGKDEKEKRVHFEFSGEDKIQYSFRTIIGGMEEEKLQIQFPKTIERIQRRKTFRITSPSGTLAIVYAVNKRFEFNVVNLSEGGALLNQKDRFHDSGLLFVGSHLKDLCFLNNEGEQKIRIDIKKADITRIEKNSETGRYGYALRFTEIGKREREKIKRFIYICQREMLKRRSFT